MGGIRIYQVDAFADRAFSGNPAAICPLEEWLPDEVMQSIAAENNLPETAFFVPGGEGGYGLRWFTPAVEVELCGHATLASAFVILDCMAAGGDAVSFDTRSGRLAVARRGDLLYLDFPALPAVEAGIPDALAAGLGAAPRTVLEGPNHMAVFAADAEVAALDPDFRELAKLHPRGVIATAARRGLRLRVALFRAGARRRRGPRDRVGPLHADPLLVGAAGPGTAARAPDLGAWRDAPLREPGSARRHRRTAPCSTWRGRSGYERPALRSGRYLAPPACWRWPERRFRSFSPIMPARTWQ